MVEIGMGRVARRSYELSEVSIVASRRTRSSQDVSTAWQLDAYRFEIPVVAHPTDALVSPEFAIELGRLGGLGVLNGEGLIGRHADVGAKIAQLVEAAEKEPEPSASPRSTRTCWAPRSPGSGRPGSPPRCGSARRTPRR
jgi:IMP dehydrogenase